jgi:hypothetical protein
MYVQVPLTAVGLQHRVEVVEEFDYLCHCEVLLPDDA